jgi:DNA-binding transcriptional regulator YiaG
MANRSHKGIDLAALRAASGLNQNDFWGKFGIGQSCGSRYENGRRMPLPIQILIRAWIDKLIDDAALAKLLSKVRQAK